MNSKERHEARYRRRKAKRDEKRAEFASRYDDFSLVYDLENLHKAAKRCCKGVRWKTSTQRYMMDEFEHIVVARHKLMNGDSVHLPFNCFSISERGKRRDIMAIHISERVIQKSLCSNVLIPLLSHYLIYDNGACQEGKGTHFALKRCVKHLSDYARRNGNDGYVLQFDIKSYFDSIPNGKLSRCLTKDLKDEALASFIGKCVMVFGDVGIGLGSEISQISAITYLNSVDHFVTNQRHIGYYGRYMDDGYAIAKSREELKSLLDGMRGILGSLGLRFNEKKTHITRISDGFVFLKTRIFISGSGKVVRIPDYSTFIRERRKISKLKRKFDAGEIGYGEIEKCYVSWVGSVRKKDSYRVISKMVAMMRKLFGARVKANGRLIAIE